jgi:hypothetical protein
MGIEVGILGLIGLILTVYAIVKTIQSDASTGAKVIWVVALLVFPILAFIVWLFFGPKG